MKTRILFVDDEPNVLQGLRRSLRIMTNAWEMDFADSGEDALQKFAVNPFDVIVSDIRMPKMDGIELLSQVRARYPHAVRIALTGHTSHETALRSAGTAHQFLAKPCDPKLLISTVHRAGDLRQKLKLDSLQQLIAGITTLPSLPHLYHQIVEELQKPNANMQRMGELIAGDIAMTAKLLQLVNSAFFGLPQRVANVSQAVVLLGAETIKALTLTVGVFSQFRGAESKIDTLVKHSIFVGTCARRISEMEGVPAALSDEAFMAGVLHDVGKLLLFTSFAEACDEIESLSKRHDLDSIELERSIFGATHADVGAALLALWGLPDPIVEAVAFHHCPSTCIHTQFAPLTAVYVANFLAGAQRDSQKCTIDMDYLQRLGLTERLETWQERCLPGAELNPASA